MGGGCDIPGAIACDILGTVGRGIPDAVSCGMLGAVGRDTIGA